MVPPEDFTKIFTFPSKLSALIERIGSLGNDAEITQISSAIDLKLDIFNHLEFDGDGDFCYTTLEIADLKFVILSLINYFESADINESRRI